MHKRNAFTLVEMLVSMALILFIMVILSTAFTTGLQVFRQLKGLGDMEERLRATSQTLRRDLSAMHFDNQRKLSDPDFWLEGPPTQGFFRIWKGANSSSEGSDGDGIPASRATADYLHFTSRLSGFGQGDFATSGWPPSVANPLSAGQDGRFNLQNANTQYRGRWFEVAYFLRPNGLTTGGSSVALYTLFRRQRGILDNPGAASGLPASAALFPEFACVPGSSPVVFLGPDSLPFPTKRFGMDGSSYPSDSVTSPISGATATRSYPHLGEYVDTEPRGADILLSDVISFEITAMSPEVSTSNNDFADIATLATLARSLDLSPSTAKPIARYLDNPLFRLGGPFMVYDTWARRSDSSGDYTQWSQSGRATSAPLTFGISAIKITIRIWDNKTQQARQITIIQDM